MFYDTPVSLASGMTVSRALWAIGALGQLTHCVSVFGISVLAINPPSVLVRLHDPSTHSACPPLPCCLLRSYPSQNSRGHLEKKNKKGCPISNEESTGKAWVIFYVRRFTWHYDLNCTCHIREALNRSFLITVKRNQYH